MPLQGLSVWEGPQIDPLECGFSIDVNVDVEIWAQTLYELSQLLRIFVRKNEYGNFQVVTSPKY